MTESNRVGKRALVALVSLSLGAGVLTGCAQTAGEVQRVEVPSAPSKIQPWEWWRDLASVASVPAGDRVVMRSSHCPSGCEFDRHSEGDSRFIRLREDGEGVIFSTEGAGAVTRIWMVMGSGVSQPLDASVRLRVRVDGRRRPVVDLPLPEVFSGTIAPFLAPMVADRTVSGGGNVSYVPIPFRNGCEITLVGADNAKIWFQVNARLVDDPAGVHSFTGKEPLDEFRSMLLRAGSDPWPGPPSPTISGSAVLAPGEDTVIAEMEGPDLLNGLVLRTKREHWGRLGLRFTFDDREPQLIPVLNLFGVPNFEGGLTKSLFVGVDNESDLYCYFPMPFFERVKVELMRRPVEGPPRIRVEYALRSAGDPPPRDAGIFNVEIRKHEKAVSSSPLELLDLEGGGSLVGLVADLRPVKGKDWTILEGDERISIDGEGTPSWHGTGVEDLFNGGFYFRDLSGRPSPFTTALAGAPFFHPSFSWAVMYRLFLSDAIVFHDGVSFELETGPRGEVGVVGRTVVFYYSAREGDRVSKAAADS